MDNLRQMRIDKGLTMKQLGEMTDVTESTIGMIETGKRKPGFELLLKLSEVFDCSIDDLVYGKKTPTVQDGGREKLLDLSELDDDQVMLIQDILKINPQQRSALLSVAESFLNGQ